MFVIYKLINCRDIVLDMIDNGEEGVCGVISDEGGRCSTAVCIEPHQPW